MDSDEEEDLPTAELYDPVWSEDLIPDTQQLCIQLKLFQSITGHTPKQQPHPHNLFKKRYSQKVNQWMSLYQMTHWTSSMFPRKNFTQILTLGHRVYSDINGEMTFEFGE